jgi:glutathionyl-hydroquinone reductase
MAVLAKGVWCPSQDEADLQAAGLTDKGVHHTISKDASPGASGKSGFTPDKDRYHLYASWACPFASRALVYRSLFGLQETIGLSIVAPTRGADGWHFETSPPYVDNVFGKRFLRDIYVAEDQATYDEAFTTLFRSLDELEERLSSQQYLLGAELTECDWRLFTTLVRFDAIYCVHFKANLRRISDYPNLSNYLRELYQVPGVAETVDMEHVKTHYYSTHRFLNPRGIVPGGHIVAFNLPHDRVRFG